MRPVHQLLLTMLMVAAIASDGGTEITIAVFTTAAISNANPFTSGTLVLQVGNVGSGSLTFSNLVPGDIRTVGLIVANDGTLALRYAMSTSVSGYATLASALQLTIRSKSANSCTSQDGTILYGPANLSNGAIGDPAHGTQPGDRLLAAGATQDLCFTVELPATSGTTLAARSLTSTFSFAAEQP